MSQQSQLRAALLNRYSVAGHFYDVKMCDGMVHNFRSVLEIFEQSPMSSLASIRENSPDCLVVMMNPGSSTPVGAGEIELRHQTESLLTKQLVQTDPDDTQYQVMQLMVAKGWKHARVLNLSDLRNPKSGKFIPAFRSLESQNFPEHSIFHERRKEELKVELPERCDAVVVLAWGVNPALRPLAERALEVLQPFPRKIGWKKKGSEWAHYHPLPRRFTEQQRWLMTVRESLDAGTYNA